MEYQVWTKEDFGETYKKVDCGDMDAVRRELDKAVREGKEPLLTVEVPYELSIKIQEVGSEAKKGKAKSDKGAGVEGDSEVRRGDEAVT
jgi:predicted transcriptional regulator